jgi:two-component system, NarL family, nitrate/nitrite response regulator NarL
MERADVTTTHAPSRNGSSARTRVLVVARVRLYRETVASMLAEAAHEVVGTVADLAGALAAVGELEPDVVVMDVSHPDALGDVERLSRRGPRPPKILALGLPATVHDAVACAEAGAAGFVTSAASPAQLADAVTRAARGELSCCEKTAAALFRRVGELARRTAPAASGERLTARELEIARLIERGLTNRDIAAELCIEQATVKNHVHNLLAKLGVRNRSEVSAALLDARAAEQAPFAGY